MVAVPARIARLSSKADELLDKHQKLLFRLDLSVNFNQSTLATKYWLPLPDLDESMLQANANPVSAGGSNGPSLAQVLDDGNECLGKLDEAASQMHIHEEMMDIDEVTGDFSKFLDV
jgi:hypothetical protein